MKKLLFSVVSSLLILATSCVPARIVKLQEFKKQGLTHEVKIVEGKVEADFISKEKVISLKKAELKEFELKSAAQIESDIKIFAETLGRGYLETFFQSNNPDILKSGLVYILLDSNGSEILRTDLPEGDIKQGRCIKAFAELDKDCIYYREVKLSIPYKKDFPYTIYLLNKQNNQRFAWEVNEIDFTELENYNGK